MCVAGHLSACRGNLTNDGGTTYNYDVENRLISASGARTASLTWDPLGRLVQVSGGWGAIRSLYDGGDFAAEYDRTGSAPPSDLREMRCHAIKICCQPDFYGHPAPSKPVCPKHSKRAGFDLNLHDRSVCLPGYFIWLGGAAHVCAVEGLG